MVGEPFEKGGCGVVNGDPACVTWVPHYCNLEARLDEPGPNDVANCILYCLEPKEYDKFFARVKLLNGWQGFGNLGHHYVVIVMGNVRKGDRLLTPYNLKDRRDTTYPIQRPFGTSSIDPEAILATAKKAKYGHAKRGKHIRRDFKAESSIYILAWCFCFFLFFFSVVVVLLLV